VQTAVQQTECNRIGKLRRPSDVGATEDGCGISPRLHVADRTTGLTFLLDTGADVSLLPLSAARCGRVATPFLLYAVNGSRVQTYGDKLMTLNLGLRRPIPWRFLVADVPRAVIGADLLRAFGLVIDLEGKCIIDKHTQISVPGFVRGYIISPSRLWIEPRSIITFYNSFWASHGHSRLFLPSRVGYVTTLRQGDLPSLASLEGCRRRSSASPRQSFSVSSNSGFAVTQGARGRLPYIWLQRNMAHGDPAGTTEDSMRSRRRTVTRCLTFTILLPISMVSKLLVRSI